MSEITAIAAVLTSVKNATDIARFLRSVDASIAQAELKIKVAELIEALADAKIAGAEVRDALDERDQEITRLRGALAIKADVVKHSDAYYRKGDDGKAIGEPFCLHCWEDAHELRNLIQIDRERKCPKCKSTYSGWNTGVIRQKTEG